MQNGYIKLAAAAPDIEVANCKHNADEIISLVKDASKLSVHLLTTPELSLTGATCGDLFHQKTLLDEAKKSLLYIANKTKTFSVIFSVGLPIYIDGKVYNCVAMLQNGKILGVVPKSFFQSKDELNSSRHFHPVDEDIAYVSFNNANHHEIPFGTDVLFKCSQLDSFVFSVEIGDDFLAPLPPSCKHTAAGANIILNPTANSEGVGKQGFRKLMIASHSARYNCAYVYSNSGFGESTTELVFSANSIIAENGKILSQAKPFQNNLIITEVDCEMLEQERGKQAGHFTKENYYDVVNFSFSPRETTLTREISSTPFVPTNINELNVNCETILNIQACALAKRLKHTKSQTAVLGISGGLDSALALLVTVRAFDMLKLKHENILAISMPGFGTTNRTKSNAEMLCKKLNVNFQTVDITKTSLSHFEDIGHDVNNHDVVFENTQARIRTLALMSFANQKNGLVVGTGDLSELALGWATFNGDHMSMYSVNASVPKTLIRSILYYEATLNPNIKDVITDISNTPVSPELLPAVDGEISQQTEEIVGPYELHDFFLYYIVRHGFTPNKIYRLAEIAFEGDYEKPMILKWLKVFHGRFFSQQFKRNCMPDGPKVGSVNFSPHGAWQMPSDASAAVWLNELEALS